MSILDLTAVHCVVKVLRGSSNSGNWNCLTIRLFEFTSYLEILVMYREGGRVSCNLAGLLMNFKIVSFHCSKEACQ